MRIAINSGHYPGLDSGACGIFSTEAELVEKVAKIVCEDLEAVGYNVLFIQENELYDIVAQSDSFNADVFVSIHANAADKTAEGTETYYFYDSWWGMTLAECIQKQLVDTMQSVDRGIKEAGFQVLTCEAIAALVELDFIDNQEREIYLNNNIEKMAHAVARGITDYVKEIDVWD